MTITGFTEIVELLISRANDEDCLSRMLMAVDAEGDTSHIWPLHHAARGEHEDVIRLLLGCGASPTKTNLFGKTPTELADPDTQARKILEADTGRI